MKKTFLSEKFRPIPVGAELDESHSVENTMQINSCLFIWDTTVSSLCIGPKNDMVIQTIEKNIQTEHQIKVVYIEELYQTWSLFCRNGEIHFVIRDSLGRNTALQPKRLYFRSGCCQPNSRYSDNLLKLINLLNLWQGEILCRPMEHRLNNSKLLQTVKTIIPVAKNNPGQCDVPKSYVVKGVKNLGKINLKQVIVKSLSGVRSDVIDEKVFSDLDKSSLNHLPILFQHKIIGRDIRVHSLNSRFYAKVVLRKKSTQSYRYQTHKDNLCDYLMSKPLKKICHELLESEQLNLAGIDFIIDEYKNYYCFEVNPGPGWSAYHADEDTRTDCFLLRIMDYLKHGNV